MLVVLATGCAPDPEKERLKQTTKATYDPKTGRLQLLTYDADKNGRIDTWTYMDGTKVLRSEIDRDEDGKIDRWEFHREDGTLEKVGFSRANEGKVDAWAYSGADGALARVEEDTNADGKPDKWETYTGGRKASVAFDENADGRADRRLTYGPGGALLSIESEPDAGGKFTKKVVVR
ncbi:MAG: hypothetical protein ACRD09_00780 [Vicinamibacterales bacterium]